MKYKIEKTEKAKALTCHLDPENKLVYLTEIPVNAKTIDLWRTFHVKLLIIPATLKLPEIEKFLKDNEILLKAIAGCFKGKKWNNYTFVGDYSENVERLVRELTWRFSVLCKNELNYLSSVIDEFFPSPDNK